MTGGRPAWYVRCDVHEVGPLRSEEAALRRVAEIEALGACPLDHEVVPPPA